MNPLVTQSTNRVPFRSRARFTLPALTVGLAVGYICFLISGVPLLAICVGGVAFATVSDWSRNRRAAGQSTSAEQVPQIADSIASSLASGVSLVEALENLVRETSGSLRFRAERILAIFESDLTIVERIAEAKRVLDCREGDLLFEILLIASVRGDDQIVSALLELSGEMRRQQALVAELKSRQSWILGSARLGQLSPWILVVLLSFRAESATAFATSAGAAVILAGVVLSLIAQRFISAGSRLDIPGRPHEGAIS